VLAEAEAEGEEADDEVLEAAEEEEALKPAEKEADVVKPKKMKSPLKRLKA